MAAPVTRTVTQKEMAELLGLTPERLRQLVPEGLPQANRDGRPCYVPREVIRWFRDREREAGRREGSGDGAPNELLERARKLKAEADLKELELAERRRLLLPSDEFLARWSSLVGTFAAVATGQLQQFERKIVQATTPADARRVTDAMRLALLRGAQEFADQTAAAIEDAA